MTTIFGSDKLEVLSQKMLIHLFNQTTKFREVSIIKVTRTPDKISPKMETVEVIFGTFLNKQEGVKSETFKFTSYAALDMCCSNTVIKKI